MDQVAYYDDLSKRLKTLLIRFEKEMPPADVKFVADYIDHNEFGLALGALAHTLVETSVEVADAEREALLALGRTMGTASPSATALREIEPY